MTTVYVNMREDICFKEKRKPLLLLPKYYVSAGTFTKYLLEPIGSLGHDMCSQSKGQG